MKSKKATYFSYILLFGFLSSFGLNTLRLDFAKPVSDKSKHESGFSLSGFSDTDNLQGGLLFEETENELEDGFEADLFTISFINACTGVLVFESIRFFSKSLFEKVTNPIYLSVCNFRI